MHRCAILIAIVAACEHEPTPPATPIVVAPAPAIAIAPDAAPPRDCAPRPIAASTVTCEAPPPAVVDRIAAQIAAVSAPDAQPDMRNVIVSCPLARGWLATTDLMPAASFHGGDPDGCPPAAGECGVIATWLFPPTGAPQLQRGLRVIENLDIDGDGRAETITIDHTNARTVWFDAGRKPIVVKPSGGWTPWQRGLAWFAGDGDPTTGFVRADAHAYRVSAAGVVDAPEIVAALWQDSVAARCPVADVVKHDLDASAPASLGPPACPGPGPDVEARLAAQITAQIEEHARERAMMLTDGAPEIAWGCNHRELTAIATYCEGDGTGVCSDGGTTGRWLHEVWTGHADAMALADRSSSSSMIMEWAVNGSVSIVGHADLDGDGEPDPILDRSSHEGGASTSEHSYEAVVGGHLIALADVTSRNADIAIRAARLPGSAADAVVIVRPADDPPDLSPAVTHVLTLAGSRARAIAGAAAVDLARRAH